MDGVRAYLIYTEAFNDSRPPSLPDFNNRESMEVHVKNMYNKAGVLEDGELFNYIDAWKRSFAFPGWN